MLRPSRLQKLDVQRESGSSRQEQPRRRCRRRPLDVRNRERARWELVTRGKRPRFRSLGAMLRCPEELFSDGEVDEGAAWRGRLGGPCDRVGAVRHLARQEPGDRAREWASSSLSRTSKGAGVSTSALVGRFNHELPLGAASGSRRPLSNTSIECSAEGLSAAASHKITSRFISLKSHLCDYD